MRMPDSELVAEIRRFILSFGEHDPDCPGIDATTWTQQCAVCICGFSSRLDELMQKLEEALVTITKRS